MTTNSKFLGLLILASLCISCSKNHLRGDLVAVDSLCESHADSALLILNKQEPDYGDPPNAWYYQFLRLKANHKTAPTYLANVDTVKDIVSFFEKEDEPRVLSEAYYFAGCSYENLNDFSTALKYYQKAIDAYPPDIAPRMTGRTYMGIGNIFIKQDMLPEAIKALLQSYRYCLSSKDSVWESLVLADIAWCYGAQKKYGQAKAYYQKAVKTAEMYHDLPSLNYIYNQQASLLLDLKEYQKVEYIYRHLTDDRYTDRSVKLYILARVYQATQREEAAMKCFGELLETGSIYNRQTASKEMGEYYLSKKQPLKALPYLKEYGLLTDSINTLNAAETVARMNACYNYQAKAKEYEELKSRNQQIIIVLTVIVAVVAVISVILLEVSYKKKRRRSNGSSGQVAVRMPQKAVDKRKAVCMSDIYQTLQEAAQDATRSRTITHEEWKDLEDLIFQMYPNMKETLGTLKKMSPHQKHVSLLIKAGFSPVEISHITRKSCGAISSTRSRLYQVNFNGPATSKQWDDFILSL